MLKKEYLFVWLFFYPVLLLSQNYCGKVFDGSTQQPLDAASVTLLSADSTIVNYTYTAENGTFCLSSTLGQQVSFIAVSFIGYERKMITINRFSNGMTISLTSTNVALKEVKVKAQRLYMKGDTLNYSVSGFKAPQDITIADVMRRMPGVEVSESGGIKYQGIDISKFYIEGIDLLADKYKLASNNLRAESIRNVQILENHEPVNSLRGKTFNEQAAVNLELKGDAKHTWLATFDLGAGVTPFLWNNHIMGMAFNKNNQLLNIYKNDNTGKNLQREVLSSVTDIVQQAEKRNMFGMTDQPVLWPVSYSTPPVEEKRYRFNSEHLLTTNQLYRIDKNKEIKYTISYLNNEEKYRNQTVWNYFYAADSVRTFDEQVIQRIKQNKLEASLIFENNGQHFFLSEKLEGKGNFNSNRTQGGIQLQSFAEKYSLPSYQVNNELKLIIPREKHRMAFSSFIQYNSLPNELEIISDDYYSFMPDSEGTVKQNISMRNFLTDHSFVVTWLKKGWQMGQKARVVYMEQQMETRLNNQNMPLSEYRFDNDNVYNRMGLYYSPFLSLKAKQFSLQAAVDFRYDHTALKSEQGHEARKADSFYVLPSLRINYDPGYWSFKGKVDVSNDYYAMRETFSSWMFRNYKTICSNEAGVEPVKNTSYTGSAFYRNPVHGFFSGISLGYRQHQSQQTADIQLTKDIYSFSRLVQAANNTWSYYGAFNLSKSVSFWNSRFFFQSLHSVTERKQLVNSTLNTYEIGSTSLSGRLFIQPYRWFNSECEIMYNSSQLKMIAPAKNNLPANEYFKYVWSNYFFVNNVVQVGINQELFHGNSGQKGAYFMDITLSLKEKKSRLTFELLNLFNSRTYSYNIYQTYQQSETSYVLRKRSLLVTFSFNI